jgi:hypothetical protein
MPTSRPKAQTPQSPPSSIARAMETISPKPVRRTAPCFATRRSTGRRRSISTASAATFTNSGLLNGATAGAWFAVIKLDADPPSNAGPIIDGFGAGDSVHPYTDGIIYDGFCTSVRKTCGNPTPSLTSVSLLGAISASADYRFYVNDKTTPFFSTGTNTVSVGTGTRYMGFSVTLSSLISGLIPELIVMDAVPSAGDLTSLWAYVNTKYGTSF